MPHLPAKPITQSSDPDVLRFLHTVSKAGLADLVIDLLRIARGETLDGRDLLAELRTAYHPIARLRGDDVP